MTCNCLECTFNAHDIAVDYTYISIHLFSSLLIFQTGMKTYIITQGR